MKNLVLIVEDDPQTGRALSRLLESWGAQVTLATNIKKARDVFSKHAAEIALVYLDAMVPQDEASYADAGTNASLVLVKEFQAFRPRFSGILFACSAVTQFTNELHQAGCEYANVKPTDLVFLQKVFQEARVRAA